MSDTSQPAPQVDPVALAHSQRLWQGFMRSTMFGIVAVVIILALLAFFLTGK